MNKIKYFSPLYNSLMKILVKKVYCINTFNVIVMM